MSHQSRTYSSRSGKSRAYRAQAPSHTVSSADPGSPLSPIAPQSQYYTQPQSTYSPSDGYYGHSPHTPSPMGAAVSPAKPRSSTSSRKGVFSRLRSNRRPRSPPMSYAEANAPDALTASPLAAKTPTTGRRLMSTRSLSLSVSRFWRDELKGKKGVPPAPLPPPPAYNDVIAKIKQAAASRDPLMPAPPSTHSSRGGRRGKGMAGTPPMRGTPGGGGFSREKELDVPAVINLMQTFAQRVEFPRATGELVLSDNESVGSFYTRGRSDKGKDIYTAFLRRKEALKDKQRWQMGAIRRQGLDLDRFPELKEEEEKEEAEPTADVAPRGPFVTPVDEKGAPINPHTSAYHGRLPLLRSYVEQGGDLEAKDVYQATALLLASERGFLDGVTLLLNAGASMAAKDENDYTALHLAAYYGHEEIVTLLLAHGAEFTAVDHRGRTPRRMSTKSSIRHLLAQAENQAYQLGKEGQGGAENINILEAVENNDAPAVNMFVQDRAHARRNPRRLEVRGRNGMTPLHLACFHGYHELVEALLFGGAEPNLADNFGETPLHLACASGAMQTARALLEAGADPMAEDNNGLVPGEKFKTYGKANMQKFLIEQAFQATPKNLLELQHFLEEIEQQCDAEEELFVQKGVAIKQALAAVMAKDAELRELNEHITTRDLEVAKLKTYLEKYQRIIARYFVKDQ